MLTKFYTKADALLTTYKNDERGVTAIEYGLIAVAMAGLLAFAMGDTGFIGELKTAFLNIKNHLATASKVTGK
jgi:pilus assembly protein Flp/PilA